MSWTSGPPQHPGATAGVEHVCPLLPVTEAEAVAVLVSILRGTASASQVVARLGMLGLQVGRVRR